MINHLYRGLLAFTMACLMAAAGAAQGSPVHPLIGNYDIYWQGQDDMPPVVLRVYRDGDGQLVADLDSTEVAYDYTTKPVKTVAGGYEIDWGLYLGSERGSLRVSHLSTADHRTVFGTYNTTKGETGSEIWRRTSPRVGQVQSMQQTQMNDWGIWRGFSYKDRFASGRSYGIKHPVGAPVVLETEFTKETNPRKMPKVFLLLYGDDLWGMQDIRVPGGSGLTVFESNWLICKPRTDSGRFIFPNAGSCLSENGIEGRAISLAVGPDARSGPNYVLFNNQIIPFQLEISGYPEIEEPDQPQLTITSFNVSQTESKDRLLEMRKARTEAQKAYELADASVMRAKKDWDRRYYEFREDVSLARDDLLDARDAAQRDMDAGLSESDAIDGLVVAQNDFNRRLSLYEGRLNDVADQLRHAIEEADRASDIYYQARHDLAQAERRADRSVISVSLMPGFSARHDPEYLRARQSLDANIALLETAVEHAEEAREKARRHMLFEDQNVSLEMEDFVWGTAASTLSQLAVEAAVQFDEGLDAGKGGPQAFLLWAGQRMYKNVYDPPKLYEPDFNLKSTPLSAEAILSAYDLEDRKVQENAAQYASKVYWEKGWLGLAKSRFKQGLIEQDMTRYIKNRVGMPVDSADYKNMTALIEKQYEALQKADKSYRAKTLQSGKTAFAREWGKDLAKDYLKKNASEKAKQLLAELFEGKAWADYASAQADFYSAVRHFKFTGHVYWKNRDMLNGLKAMRAALDDIEAEHSEGWVYSSEPMALKANMPIYLFLDGVQAPDEEGVDRTYYDAPLKASINGVALTRLAGTNHFLVPSDAIETLKSTDLDHAILIVTE
ncbi:hypothetical protein [Hyphomonas sp.]|uniref:hypothetical protein n=1 Tax=Hyphomonas sp. TaxID=87 RepID=UPI0035287A55